MVLSVFPCLEHPKRLLFFTSILINIAMVYDTNLWLWAVGGLPTFQGQGPSTVGLASGLDTQFCPSPGCSNGEPRKHLNRFISSFTRGIYIWLLS